jgi:hypothetical protein
MPFPWMNGWFTIENSATFKTNTCPACHRYLQTDARPPARPTCLLNTRDDAEILERAAEGNPVYDSLAYWEPAQCGEMFPTEDPLLHLKMEDDADNPTIHDVRDCYDQEFKSIAGNPNTSAHSVAGKFGNALSFDGTNDYFKIANTPYTFPFSSDQDFSLCFWIKFTATAGSPTRYPIGNFASLTTCLYITTIASYTMICIDFRWTGGSNLVRSSNLSTAINTWYLVSFVRNGTTINLYRNTTLVKTNTHAHNADTLVFSARPLTFGMLPALTNGRPCVLDDIRIYTRALTATEITALYNA